MTQDDPVDRLFEALRQEQPMPAANAGLEQRLVREMRERPARRRRLRLVVVVTLLALFALGGGVHAAGGLRVIRIWLGDVRAIEVHGEPGKEPRLFFYDESGNVIGTGRLPPPDENGDYQLRIQPDN